MTKHKNMPKLIYLEPDEEITDVIDKISKVDSNSVSLVIPRGSTLANSIVNLKLLVKRSKSLKKDVALVTNDNIAHNLASQIGLPVYESIEDAKSGTPEPEVKPRVELPKKVSEPEEIDGVKVHQYDRGDMDTIEDESQKSKVKSQNEGELEEIQSEPEIIEAVRDADTDSQEDEEAVSPTEKIPVAENNDFKLTKKPMEERPRQRENFEHLGANNNQVFGKMRGARNRRKMVITWGAVGFAILLILGAYIALPKAKVTLAVVSEPFTSNAEVKVEKDRTLIDSEAASIPGKLISKEEELEKPFAASGSKNIGSNAKGKVTLYNYWDNKAHEIAAGSKLQTSGGVVFVTKEKVSIPAGTANIIPPSTYEINPPGTVDVNVEAEQVGEQGNVGATNFTITSLPSVQQSKIYGKSTGVMSGGTNNMVKVVADKDLTDAKASTENELKTKILNSIKEDLKDNEKLLDSAIAATITSESASVKSGDQVDTFNYKMKIKVEALVFSEDDFKTVLLEKAKKELAEDKEIVTGNTESVKYEVSKADVAAGVITLKGTFEGYIANHYDVDKMRSEIHFKSNTKATKILTAYPGVLSADIVGNPNFLRSLPALEKRIEIEFNYGSTSFTTGGGQ